MDTSIFEDEQQNYNMILTSLSGLVLINASSFASDNHDIDSLIRIVAKLAGTMAALSQSIMPFELCYSNQIYFVLPMSADLPFLIVLSCSNFDATQLSLLALQLRHALHLLVAPQLKDLAVALSQHDECQLRGSTFHDVAAGTDLQDVQNGAEIDQLLDLVNMQYVRPLLCNNVSRMWTNLLRQHLAHLCSTPDTYRFFLILHNTQHPIERILPLDSGGAVVADWQWCECLRSCSSNDAEWVTFTANDDDELTLILSKTNALDVYLCATIPESHLPYFTSVWSAMLFRFNQYHPLSAPSVITEDSLLNMLDVSAPVGMEKGAIPPTAPMAPKKAPRPQARYS